MLSSLRGGATSFFAMVLIGLLIVSFAIWGIGDVFRMGGNTDVAQIGEKAVKPSDYARTFQLYYNRLRQQFGEDFTMDQAVQIGLDKRALLDEVTRQTFNEAANQLGLRATDDQVRQQIHETPAFQDSLGQFNKFIFEQSIRYMGYSEKEFLDITRTDITRNNLISAMTDVMSASRSQTELLYKFYREERLANILTVPASSISLTTEPSTDDLLAYYEQNQDSFMTPELRAVTYAILQPENVHNNIDITEEELRQAYEEQPDRFNTAQKRSMRQFVLPTKAEAEDAAQAIANGETFANVAQRIAGLSADDLDLGEKTQSDLAEDFDDDIAATVFSLQKNQPSAPIEGPFGWHIFITDDMTASEHRRFEDVRSVLAAELKSQKAVDRIYEISAEIEDELAAGTSVIDIATKFNLPVRNIAALDGVGRGANGQPAQNFPDYIPGFLTTVFSMDEGDEPLMHDLGDNGYYLLSVDKVTPETQQSFEDVRELVQNLWTAAQKTKAAETLANDLIEQAKETGTPLNDLNSKVNKGQFTSLSLRRDSTMEDTGLAQELKQALFTADVGSILSLNAPNGDGFVILKIAESTLGKPESDPQGLSEMQNQLKIALTNDALSSYQNYLVKTLPVIINGPVAQQVIDQMVTRDQ
ncbi:MAG: hypothetical protein CMF31_10370 [Kordiimonas sp.]|nr:hypothetical protein [Kordiimonas sp.]